MALLIILITFIVCGFLSWILVGALVLRATKLVINKDNTLILDDANCVDGPDWAVILSWPIWLTVIVVTLFGRFILSLCFTEKKKWR